MVDRAWKNGPHLWSYLTYNDSTCTSVNGLRNDDRWAYSIMNMPGVAAVVQSIMRPGLLVPHLRVACVYFRLTYAAISHLNWKQMYASGARYIVFDKDNCLVRV